MDGHDKHTTSQNAIPGDDTSPKPYERLPDEPNRWYHRFFRFMRLGPERTLIQCYKDISNAARAAKGRPPLSASARLPQSWRQRARQFSWHERAEAWDQEQKELELKKVERTRSLARSCAQEAMQVHIDLMNGELKDPDGKLTEGQNSAQRRLAADSVLDRAGVLPDTTEPEEEQEVPVVALHVYRPGADGKIIETIE